MKGLELSEEFYNEYGLPMLEKNFGNCIDKMAIGLVGHGSECFGYDDEISQDHDFEPGFCIWLTDEDEADFGFRLFRAYRNLPSEYKGYKLNNKSLAGSDNKGVKLIKEFYSFYTGSGDVPCCNEEWLNIPDFYLAEATNGKVFADKKGEFTRIRNALLNERPEDVRIKKLASSLFYMAQAGQYNYYRIYKHGEYASAALALADFARNAASAVFLLNRKYAPYYKWLFRGMRNLEIMGDTEKMLTDILKNPFDVEKNINVIETISKKIVCELQISGLSEICTPELEMQAYKISENIKDGNLRNMPVML